MPGVSGIPILGGTVVFTAGMEKRANKSYTDVKKYLPPP